MTDYQRIEAIKKYTKLSANALSKELQLKSPQIFYDIKAGKCGISKDLAHKITEKFFNIDYTWLLTGKGEMLLPPKNPFSQMTENEIGNITYEVFAAELMKKYESGEIYPAEVHNRIVAEKEKRIEELQRKIWELQRKLDELSEK